MRTMRTVLMISMAIAAALPPSAAALAETPEEKGLAIAIAAERYDSGFGDYAAEGKMTLRNRHGKESVRVFANRILEVDGDGDKSLNLFSTPRDIRGTAVLTYTHKTGNDDQWLYLPALKRVKRISSSNKSGSFVGSEFAYEDLSSQEVEKYTYKWLRDESCPDAEKLACFVNERYPTDRKSGYTRQVVWMEQQTFRAFKIDFYDRKDSFLKTLTFSGYKPYLDKHWRPDSMNMINHQTGKSTEILWSGYAFRTGLGGGDFKPNALKRLR